MMKLNNTLYLFIFLLKTFSYLTCRISWLLVYLPMLLIISVGVTIAMVGFFTQGLAFLLFFVGCVLHSFWSFGFAFLVSTFFTSASSANRVTHVLSFALFATYFLSGYLRGGILYPFSAAWFYLLCLVEPIAFGTLIQRVHLSTYPT